MKKFFMAVILFVMVISKVSIVQAVTNSSQAEFNSALSVSVTALNETAGYSNAINNGDYNSALFYRDKCSSQSEVLGFWENNLSGKEALECLLLTDIIVMARGQTLDCYLEAVNAYRSGQMNLYNEYLQRMYSCYNSAEQSRQEFRAKYGY